MQLSCILLSSQHNPNEVKKLRYCINNFTDKSKATAYPVSFYEKTIFIDSTTEYTHDSTGTKTSV